MNTDTGIFFSVLIPVWNRCESVLEAVRSIGSASEGIEIVVVDDGSGEPIAGQLQDGLRGYPQVKFYRNEVNLGMVCRQTETRSQRNAAGNRGT